MTDTNVKDTTVISRVMRLTERQTEYLDSIGGSPGVRKLIDTYMQNDTAPDTKLAGRYHVGLYQAQLDWIDEHGGAKFFRELLEHQMLNKNQARDFADMRRYERAKADFEAMNKDVYVASMHKSLAALGNGHDYEHLSDLIARLEVLREQAEPSVSDEDTLEAKYPFLYDESLNSPEAFFKLRRRDDIISIRRPAFEQVYDELGRERDALGIVCLTERYVNVLLTDQAILELFSLGLDYCTRYRDDVTLRTRDYYCKLATTLYKKFPDITERLN